MSKRFGTLCCCMVIIFPIVFYIPKFMEYRYEKFVHNFPTPINCSQLVLEQREMLEFDEKFSWVSYEGLYINSVCKKKGFDVRLKPCF